MKVLSLCDGMSCAHLALERLGVKVDAYYASEIEPSSIKVTQHNYPETVQLGDVIALSENDELLESLGEIDLLAFGFPCRNLSQIVANDSRANQGLAGASSKIFFNCVKILEKVKPRYFLCENVESMKNADRDVITGYLGVEPIMINSSLVSAQDRKRYYWTNIDVKEQPEDRGLVISDIIEPADAVTEKYWYRGRAYTYHGEDARPVATLDLFKYEMTRRVYGLHQKAPTLSACRGGHKQKKVLQDGVARKLTPIEYERLQTVPEGYTACVADTHRYNMLGDGWTVDVIAHILKYADFDERMAE